MLKENVAFLERLNIASDFYFKGNKFEKFIDQKTIKNFARFSIHPHKLHRMLRIFEKNYENQRISEYVFLQEKTNVVIGIVNKKDLKINLLKVTRVTSKGSYSRIRPIIKC